MLESVKLKVHKVLMKPDNIFEISSLCLKSESNFVLLILFRSIARYNIERTSTDEPFEIYKYCLSSLLVLRSNPSAILFIIDTDARCIWSLNPKS